MPVRPICCFAARPSLLVENWSFVSLTLQRLAVPLNGGWGAGQHAGGLCVVWGEVVCSLLKYKKKYQLSHEKICERSFSSDSVRGVKRVRAGL